MTQTGFDLQQSGSLRHELRRTEAYQRRSNRVNSLIAKECFEFEFCDLRFICNLWFEIWNLSDVMEEKALLVQSEFFQVRI